MTSSNYQLLGHKSIVFLHFILLTQAATTVLGPTAVMSIASSPAWATMKPCAQGCFIDNSLYHGWPCNMKGPDQWDLGLELACGCSPQNYCFCGKNDAAKASAYISSCVDKACAGFPAELTSAIQLYDGYCKTANVEVAAVTTTPIVPSSATAASNPSTLANAGAENTRGSTTLRTSPEGAASNTSPDSNSRQTTSSSPEPTASDGEKHKGLSQSDIVALAVGLGVGIPTILLGLASFCLARRNYRRNQMARRLSRYGSPN